MVSSVVYQASRPLRLQLQVQPTSQGIETMCVRCAGLWVFLGN
jgi:hypothetical protein